MDATIDDGSEESSVQHFKRGALILLCLFGLVGCATIEQSDAREYRVSSDDGRTITLRLCVDVAAKIVDAEIVEEGPEEVHVVVVLKRDRGGHIDMCYVEEVDVVLAEPLGERDLIGPDGHRIPEQDDA